MRYILSALFCFILLNSADAGVLLRKKTMTYDVFNRQLSWSLSVSDGQGGWTVEKSESSTYRGAEWHRASSTSSGTTTNYLYDGNNVIADIVGGSVVKSYCTPGLDSNVSMTDIGTSTTYYYNQDERQSVRNLTNTNGAVVQSYDYTAYGDKIDVLTSGSAFQRYTYTGRELNEVSGDYYFRYRVYGAYLGGFMSRDPLRYTDGMSVYSGWFASGFGQDPLGTFFVNFLKPNPEITYDKKRTYNQNAINNGRKQKPPFSKGFIWAHTSANLQLDCKCVKTICEGEYFSIIDAIFGPDEEWHYSNQTTLNVQALVTIFEAAIKQVAPYSKVNLKDVESYEMDHVNDINAWAQGVPQDNGVAAAENAISAKTYDTEADCIADCQAGLGGAIGVSYKAAHAASIKKWDASGIHNTFPSGRP